MARGASFNSKTVGKKSPGGGGGAAGAVAHIDRTEEIDPPYLLPPMMRDPRGNVFKHVLSVDELNAEAAKYGGFHVNAKPIRHAVINTEKHHEIEDLEKLVVRLEKELGIRAMSYAIHRDEGTHSTGKINWHAHLLFTNWSEGKSNHFDNVCCRKAQDICAEELGMERGQRGSKKPRFEHPEFREMKRRMEVLENQHAAETLNLKTEIKELEIDHRREINEAKEENISLRQELKDSKTAEQSDYQNQKLAHDAEIARLKKEHEEKLAEKLKKLKESKEVNERLEQSDRSQAAEIERLKTENEKNKGHARNHITELFCTEVYYAKNRDRVDELKEEFRDRGVLQTAELKARFDEAVAEKERELAPTKSRGR